MAQGSISLRIPGGGHGHCPVSVFFGYAYTILDFVLLPIERSGSGVAPDVVKLTTGREAPPSSPLALQYESGVTITFGSRPIALQQGVAQGSVARSPL